MKEATGDLWKFPCDALCIPTNGTRRHDGCAVMGRGVAAQAAQRWPWLPRALGDSLGDKGTTSPFCGSRSRCPSSYHFPSKSTGGTWPTWT